MTEDAYDPSKDVHKNLARFQERLYSDELGYSGCGSDPSYVQGREKAGIIRQSNGILLILKDKMNPKQLQILLQHSKRLYNQWPRGLLLALSYLHRNWHTPYREGNHIKELDDFLSYGKKIEEELPRGWTPEARWSIQNPSGKAVFSFPA